MSISRRKRFLLGLALTACLGAAAAWGLLDTYAVCTPGVTRANFRRLHAGMTVDEVEAALGGPADVRRLDSWVRHTYVWFGDEGQVTITNDVLSRRLEGSFDGGGGSVHLAPAPRPFFERLQRWLRL